MSVEFISGKDHYDKVVAKVASVRKSLWIGTADIKDLHVKAGNSSEPFLAVLAKLLKRGVEVRLIHAKEPGPAFREDFDRYTLSLKPPQSNSTVYGAASTAPAAVAANTAPTLSNKVLFRKSAGVFITNSVFINIPEFSCKDLSQIFTSNRLGSRSSKWSRLVVTLGLGMVLYFTGHFKFSDRMSCDVKIKCRDDT